MRSLRFNLLLGVVAYTSLLVLAVFFYKERTIFIDIAYHLFEIIKGKSFAIQNNRFGAFITQAFPLVTSLLGVSLKNVMVAYSAGFVIYYFGVFLLCLLLFRNAELAIGLLLFNVLLVSGTFYWIQSEFPQGLAFTFLYFSALKWQSIRERESYVLNAGLMLMLFTLAFFHPLLTIVYLFFTLFYLFSQPSPAFKRTLITNLGVFLGFVFIKAIFFKTQYDSQAMSGVKNFWLLFPDYFSIDSNKNFLKYLVFDYYLLPILFAVILIFYFKKQGYFKMLLVTAFFFSYLLLVNVSYPKGTDQFYIENLYLPLSLFLIIPFVYDVLPNLKKRLAGGILVGLIAIRILHIWQEHQTFTVRLSALRTIMNETAAAPQKKIIVKENQAHKDNLLLTWATPYEFWLLSTLETGETRSTLIHENPESLKWMLPGNKQFFTTWGSFEYKELPKKYFVLQDSSTYEVLN